LREQLIQLLAMLHPETGQGVVVHYFASRQPLQRWFPLAPPRHFPCRTDPLAVGVNPQADQQPRIKRRPPTFFGAARNPLVEAGQIQAPDQFPDRSRRMVFPDQSLHIHRSPHHLLAIHPAD
jgi:hypothetical protein